MALSANNNIASKPAKKKDNAQTDATKAAASAAVNASVDNENVGSLSDTIALVGLVRDPSQKDRIKNAEGETVTYGRIVGYQIKNVGDQEYKYTSYAVGSKKDRMAAGEATEKVLKPGETANMTIPTVAAFVAPIEFNGRITGGERKAHGRYAKPKAPAASAELESSANFNFVLSPITTGDEKWQIQDLNGVDALKVEVDPETKRVSSRTLVEGFEEWAILAKTASRANRTRSAEKRGQQRDASAAAYLELLGKGQSIRG